MTQKSKSEKTNKAAREVASIPTLIMWERTPLDGVFNDIRYEELLGRFKDEVGAFELVVIDSGRSAKSNQNKGKPPTFKQPTKTTPYSLVGNNNTSRLENLGSVLASIQSDNRYYYIGTGDLELLAAFSLFACTLFPGRLVRFIKPEDPSERYINISQEYNLNSISSAIRYELDYKYQKQHGSDGYGDIEIKQMKEIDHIASMKIPPHLLLLGETGVGKTRLAKYYYESGSNKNKDTVKDPVVEVNCSCFTETNFDYEMFGYEAGAYTGALKADRGMFEKANGKVLFLDEVADLSLENQVRLLKALDRDDNGYYTYTKKGSRNDKKLTTKFKLVCATRKNLKEEVLQERFREDLYYRIAGHTITVRPLRERRHEIRELLEIFCKNRDGFGFQDLNEDVLKELEGFHWPGNIRQLKHAVEVMHIRFRVKGKLTVTDVKEIFEEGSLRQDQNPLSIPQGVEFHEHIENLKKRVLQQNLLEYPHMTVEERLEHIKISKTTYQKYKPKD